MLTPVGKLFAALIMICALAWLGPMCSRLPANPSSVAVPIPPIAPIVTALSSAAGIAPAPAVAPAQPAPATERPVTVATYRSRRMFPIVNGKYIVSVLRANKTDVSAVGVKLSLSTRLNGQVVERAESGPAQTLAAGTTSYFGLNVSTVVFDVLLDATEEDGNELEWTLSYRLEYDEPGAKRCFILRALPRRLGPEGIDWRRLGESRSCKN